MKYIAFIIPFTATCTSKSSVLLCARQSDQTLSASIPQDSANPSLPTSSSSLPPRAPRTFIRLRQTEEDDETLLLQTAITTYISPDSNAQTQTLQIHSLLHVADKPYYTSLQASMHELTTVHNGTVLFEILTSSRNITQKPPYTYPRLSQQTAATSSARAAATALGAVPQADEINATLPHWRIADLSIEDIDANITVSSQTSENFQPTKSNLFKITTGRIALFCVSAFLPCPELYLSLYDSATGKSNFSFRSILSSTRSTNKSKHKENNGRLTAMRRSTFAFRIANTSVNTRPQSDMSRLRNEAAWKAVKNALSKTEENTSSAAVLYGAWHSAALCRCAEADGWTFSHVTWRTAMVVDAPRATVIRVMPFVLAFSGYIVYAALDWVNVVDIIATALEQVTSQEELLQTVCLYAFRHIAPYVMFMRWFRVWDDI